MARNWILAGTVLLLTGCASFTPRYARDAPVQAVSAHYNMKIAVPPVSERPVNFRFWGGAYKDYSILNSMYRFNGTAFCAVVVKHLQNKRVFEAQEAVAAKYRDCTPANLQQLKTEGYHAVLLCDVVNIQGGRGATPLQQAGDVLGSPVLGVAGATQKSANYANSVVRFKLVNTSDGSTLWFGDGTGNVFQESGHRLDAVVTESLKAAINSVIRDMESANFQKQ